MASTVAVNLALNGLGGVLGGLGRLDGALGAVGRGIGGAVAGVGTVLAGAATAGAVALGGLGIVVGTTGVDFLALKEQALTAFTTMLGSSSAGQAFFNSLQQFAATTPFELPGILSASQRLLAFGFAAKEILPDLTAIGNAVAATGGNQANLDRIVLALGQMKAKGKVQGDEMLQLTESNIAAWDYLAKFLHTDVATAMKMVTKGLVTGQQGIDAIIQGLSKDPKFAGMMAAQSHTFTGLVSNMHDYWNQFTAAIMEPVFDRALKPGLEWLTGWLSGPGQALGARIGQGLAGGLDRAARAFRGVMGIVREFRDVLGGNMGAGGIGGRLAVGFLLIRNTIANRVIPAVQLLWRTFAGGLGGGDVRGLFDRILAGAVNLAEMIGRGFQLGIDAIVTFKQALAGDWFKNGSGNAFVDTIGRIGLALRDIGLAFQSGGVGAALGTLWSGYLQPALTNAWTSLQSWITGTAIPNVTTWLGGLASGFGSWVRESLPGLATNLATWLMGLGTWLLGTAIPAVGTWLNTMATRFGDWLTETAIPYVTAKLPLFLVALQGAILGWGLVIQPWLAQLGANFGEWLTGAALPALATFIANAFARLQLLIAANLPGILIAYYGWVVGVLLPKIAAGLFQVGVAFVQGLALGIDSQWPGFIKHIQDLLKIIPGPIRDHLGLNFESTGSAVGGGVDGGGATPGGGGGGGGGGLFGTPVSPLPPGETTQAPTIVVNLTANYNSPLTAADVARAHAAELLAAMRDGLGDGGGLVTA